MADYFVYDGKSTAQFGMVAESHPAQGAPKRRRTAIEIPGRNGVLHYDEGAYENYPQEYSVWFKGELPTPEQAHAVKAWLLGGTGYRRLEDKYDPTHFRLASFAGPLTVQNILGRYGRCKLSFDCDPRCFLKDGEAAVHFAAAGYIYNPTVFAADPLIRVYGTAAGSVTVAGVTVQVLSITTGLMLDCENENAYALGDVGQSLNSTIYAKEFPVLLPGENRVSFDGGITAVEIIPRWWEL